MTLQSSVTPRSKITTRSRIARGCGERRLFRGLRESITRKLRAHPKNRPRFNVQCLSWRVLIDGTRPKAELGRPSLIFAKSARKSSDVWEGEYRTHLRVARYLIDPDYNPEASARRRRPAAHSGSKQDWTNWDKIAQKLQYHRAYLIRHDPLPTARAASPNLGRGECR